MSTPVAVTHLVENLERGGLERAYMLRILRVPVRGQMGIGKAQGQSVGQVTGGEHRNPWLLSAAARQPLDAHIGDCAAAQDGKSERPPGIRHRRRIGVLHAQGLGDNLGLGPALAARGALIDLLQPDQIRREAG